MPRNSYPTSSDLEARLSASKVSALSSENLALFREAGAFDSAIAAAIAEWEAATEWRVYLAPASPSTLYFDPPISAGLFGAPKIGQRLILSPPLLSLVSVTVSGSPLRQGSGFVLRPQNAPLEGKPYQWIDFTNPPTSTEAGSIAITGRFGAVSALPDDVWNAILQLAQAALSPDLSLAISKGVTETRIGDVVKRYAGMGSGGPLDLQATLWQNTFKRIVEREKRVVF